MDKTVELLSISSLPKRSKNPGQSLFRKIVIESNRFKVDVSKLSCLCIFAIKIVAEKQEENHEKRIQILDEILPEIKEFIHDPIIKDGLIFSHRPPKTPDKTIKHGNYIIVIREITRFDAQKSSHLLLYFLGNVMRKVMEKLEYIAVGNTRKFVNMKNNKEVENVLVYSGFKVHFELLENGYYLTVDTTKKIVRNESVLEYINYVYKMNDGLERNEKREMVRKGLMNRTIMTNYGKTRYVKVEDVLFVDLSQVIIESCKMPLPEYYKFRYDYEIKNLKQPLIYANNKKSKFKTYLVPELCLMTGIPEDFDQARNKYITDVSRISAEEKKEQIQEFVKSMNTKQGNELFELLGVTISEKCEKVEGKLIPPPRIVLGQGKVIPKGRQSNFSVQDIPIYRIREATKLGILAFDDVDSTTITQYFYKTFKALKIKIEISVIKVEAASCKRGIEALTTHIELAKDRENCNICLIILPNRLKHQYQKIKEITLLQKEVGCQVVLESTLKNKNLMSVALKVLLQILSKAGHTVWKAVSQMHRQKVMFVGYYSSEVGRVKTNQYTVGICATCDDSHTQIFAKTQKYAKQHEELQSMKELLLEALAVYRKKNGSLPLDIVIIENKKSPRNEQSSINFFIQPLIKMMEEYYGLTRPKVIYLVLTKCLTDRFFRMFEGRCANPPIGTLINQQVNSSKADFYLIAHNICKKGGSITPLNYKIVFSDSTLEAEALYSMVFAQCFNYPNYTGAIRQPGILQSAIKCTKFGAEVLSNLQVPEKFKLYPYFL